MTNENNDLKPKFDPMTGEPLANNESEERYDPMTGEPLFNNESDTKDDTVTEESVKPKADKSAAFGQKLKSIFSKDNIANLKHKKAFKPICIILIILIVLTLAFQVFANIPKNKVILAAIKTGYDIENKKSIDDDVFGLSSFINTLNSKDTEVSFKIGDDEGQISISSKNSPKKNKSELYGKLTRDDNDTVADYYLYNDENQRVFGFPEIYDDIFVYNKNSDVDNYNKIMKSLTLFKSDILDFDHNYEDGSIGVATTAYGYKISQIMGNYIYNVISKVDSIDVYKSISVEKSDPTQVSISDKDENCKGYVMTIPKSLNKKIIDIAIDEAEKNNVMSKIALIQNPKLSKIEANRLEKDFIKSLENLKDSAKDVKINIYLYKGAIVSVDFKINTDESTTKFRLSLTGAKNPIDSMLVNIQKENGDEESEFEVKIDTDYNKGSKQYTKDADVKFVINGVEVTLNNKLDYDTKEKSIDNKTTLETPFGDVQILKLNATVDQLKKGKEAEITINKLRLGDEDLDLVVKGEFNFKKASQKIEPKKATINVKDLSNNEIEKSVSKIQDKLYNGVSKLNESVIGYYLNSYYYFG